jgi:hypothetical protein
MIINGQRAQAFQAAAGPKPTCRLNTCVFVLFLEQYAKSKGSTQTNTDQIKKEKHTYPTYQSIKQTNLIKQTKKHSSPSSCDMNIKTKIHKQMKCKNRARNC